ncbi:unnamed protein product [Caenorhabditis auriculariae]|uniref:Uncharacterized protein n=1 Tax=Caenorhabditis auriculariae TaxID=2777116 RepID=A0A8S1HKS3_9PELO|nr:unnamed protein product [Caenorhabditis auriculariae]
MNRVPKESSEEKDDACRFFYNDYCHFFGDSSCYIRLCHCEKCHENENLTFSGEISANSTQNCPAWCGNSTAEGIFNIQNEGKKSRPLKIISMECNSLKKNCRRHKGLNGYCHFWRKNCADDDSQDEVVRILNAKRGKKHFRKVKKCKKMQSKCAEKWPKHYACRFFKKNCKSLGLEGPSNSTDVFTGNFTLF